MEKKASANGWSALTSSASMDWRQLWNVREAHIAADGMRIAPRGGLADVLSRSKQARHR